MTPICPLRFVPFVRPLVWGGRKLADRLRKALPASQPCGESWEISDHPLHRSIVAAGPHQGRSLRDLMHSEREALLGAGCAATVFPWLVKFLDAADWLSVQVHPDEAAVQRLWPGEGAKTEAWYVIEAAAGARIYAGLAPGTTEATLRRALADGDVARCLHAFEPRAGDCLFLPAGTVHAVGGGVLLAEVQQTSDATFRLFDWNRRDTAGKPRPLHVDQALASIHWDQGPVPPIRTPAKPGRTPLVRCPYFALERLDATEAFACGGIGRLQVLIVLEGRARGWGEEALEAGQVWLFPAAIAATSIHPERSLTGLLCTQP